MSRSLETARAVVAETLEIDIEGVGEDASIDTLEAWDSLAHMRLVLAVEKILGRELAPETVVGIGGVGDIAAILEGG